MKHFPHSFFAVALLLIALAGCAASPRQQWSVARESLTQTENGLVAAHQAHVLSDKAFVATEPYIKSVRASLEKADEELIASHDQPTKLARFYLDSAAAVLPPLQKVGAK